MSVGNVSQLERGIQGYSDEGLEALAEALNCEPGHILSVNPLAPDAIWSIWERASEAEKAQVAAVARALIKRAS